MCNKHPAFVVNKIKRNQGWYRVYALLVDLLGVFVWEGYMSKKHDFSKKDMISVYRFMGMCGLECKKRSSVPISHEAMIRKICCRYRKFPDKVCLPVKVPFSLITNEMVKSGKVLLVEDDYGKLIPYERPMLLVERVLNYSADEREEIREKLIEEEKLKNKNEISDGYLKYLLKKDQRELEAEQKMIQEELLQDQADEINGFTEDQVKVRKFGKRVY